VNRWQRFGFLTSLMALACTLLGLRGRAPAVGVAVTVIPSSAYLRFMPAECSS
jgi:hypothetical protein